MKITSFRIQTGKIKNNDHFRIVHISDLHKKKFGKNNSALSEKILSLDPDAVFMTGDMISRSSSDLTPLKALINDISEKIPVYYSLGNHEQDAEYVNSDIYTDLIKFIKSRCVLLDNDTCRIEKENFTLSISGLTVFRECYKVNNHYKNLRKVNCQHICDFLKTKPDDRYVNILMAHNPNFFNAYCEYGSDIILSGHVHGGCVRLPFIGGVLSPERKFFPKYDSGEYRKGNTSMIVSCGLGKFRMFNPSEISVIDIF